MPGLVVLVGHAGVGKTTVGKRLAACLGVPLTGPDDYPDRWAGLARRLAGELQGRGAVVECCRIHGILKAALGNGGRVVHLTLDEEERQRRLISRGDVALALTAAPYAGIDYDGTVAPDLVESTTDDPDDVAQRLAAALV